MAVALGRATVDGHTLFGQNVARPAGESVALCRAPGREFVPGEVLQTPFLALPQARHTYTVLAAQSPECWGYHHGLNECGVAAGCASLLNKLRPAGPGLTGTDLVRLLLERSRTARQAVDLFADLIERHGLGVPEPAGEGEADQAFVIADGAEAFVIETAANHWV
jgi:dipeptidase